ncbi:hypothetical protein PHLCEN_2v4149 [Hermanssonia centrifuga]|uniref:Uncharacterized protein n=1 Tax=Hermanssonia centrifuga TaxID=98765 RepID=A0A2R6PZ62_9APHY|nr:hypothetical protein PHLCEN_2v4149 [Hermanssonia centrifuga]
MSYLPSPSATVSHIPLISGLIAGRVWWSSYRVSRICTGPRYVGYNPVIDTIIRSAAIYSAALAALLGTYAAGSMAQYIWLDSLQPIIGIVFTLIIIRIGLRDAERNSDEIRQCERKLSQDATGNMGLNSSEISATVSRPSLHVSVYKIAPYSVRHDPESGCGQSDFLAR